MKLDESKQCQNTDKEIWRERTDDYYADSIFVTESGLIGINCGGICILMPIRKWFECADQRKRTGIENVRELADRVNEESPLCKKCGYHIDRDEDGYEVLILHAIDEHDEDEKWLRYDIYEGLCKALRGDKEVLS